MQHGEAQAAEVDPFRPVSDAGRASVRAVAGHAAVAGVRIGRIVHSGKLRAEQTALILADASYCTDVSAHSGLAPMDDVHEAVARLVHPESSSLAIVGHLPFLDRFASLLVAGDPEAHVVKFRNAGLVHLVRVGSHGAGEPAGSFAVSWLLVPELATS